MYEEYYKLEGPPFRINPDPRFFFASKGHKRAMAYLRYGLQRKEGFIVVTGSPGTGKTTLARTLLDDPAHERVVVSQLNTTQLEAEDTLRMVSASFGLEHENLPKASLLKRLETFFMRRLRAGEHVLLLIDEAQNLPVASLEELRMLSNFHMGNHALVQIFLLGQQQFRDRLNTPELEQLRQRVVAACHLNPLDPVETRAYVEHRLRFVGWKGDPRITSKAFARIYAYTQGIPRRINSFCDRMLLYGALEELHEFDENVAQAVYEELSDEISFEAGPIPEDLPEAVEAPPMPEPEPEPAPEAEPEPEPEPEQVEHVRASDRSLPAVSIDRPDEPASAPVKPRTTGERRVLPLGPATRRVLLDEDTQQGLMDNLESAAPFTQLVVLALDFLRAPQRHQQLTMPDWLLPEGVHELLQLAVGRLELPTELGDGQSLQSNRREIKEAAQNFIRKVLLAPGGSHYRVLGVAEDAPQEVITAHYQLLFRLFQPGQGGQPWNREHVARINEAYNVLRDRARRRAYDAELQAPEFIDPEEELDSVPVLRVEPDEEAADFSDAMGRAEAAPTFVLKPQATTGSIRREPKKDSRLVWNLLFGVTLIAVAALFYFNPVLYGRYVEPWLQDASDTQAERPTFGGTVEPRDPGGDAPEATSDRGSRSLERRDAVDGASPERRLQESHASEPREEVDDKAEGETPAKDVPAPSDGRHGGEAASTRQTSAVAAPEEIEKVIEDAVVKTESAEAAPLAQPKVTPKPAEKPAAAVADARDSAPPERVRPEVTAVTPKQPEATETRSQREVAEVAPEPEVAEVKPKPKARQNTSPDTMAEAQAVAEPPPAAAVAVIDASPEPTPAAERIPTESLNTLVERFTSMYEAGDIDRFMRLFSPAAYTNDQVDVAGIREDYQTLFEGTDGRDMEITNMKWKREGNTARGEGEFRVAVRQRGDRFFSKVFSGTIVVQVAAEGNETPRITGLYHVYSNDQR